ncbi:MAG TPA: glycosyltransferase family 2 protein [Candidatus Binataceae bacterium]|nr:glycosyltransferase family 2 protein [Candidatus Binataceae bacterium]
MAVTRTELSATEFDTHESDGGAVASTSAIGAHGARGAAMRPVTMPGRLAGLTVFLPSHNEEGNVERVVSSFLAELPKVAEVFEVVVIDDGSVDRTGEIADRIAAADARVRVVHHAVNRGYGAAVATGLKTARQPFILLCDGDGQFDPADMERLAARIGDHDVVIGRRARRADHLMRRINGKAWTTLSRILFGLHISDMDCGFKLFRRSAVENLELHSSGAMVTTELMARLAGRNARICAVNVTHLPRVSGEQTGNSPSVIIGAFRDLFALYRELKKARKGVAAQL